MIELTLRVHSRDEEPKREKGLIVWRDITEVRKLVFFHTARYDFKSKKFIVDPGMMPLQPYFWAYQEDFLLFENHDTDLAIAIE